MIWSIRSLRFLSFLVLGFALLAALPTAVSAARVVHARLSPLSARDYVHAPRPRTAQVDESPLWLTLALAQPNAESAESLLLDLADPRSSRYGHWLSFDGVNSLFAPRSNDLETVYNWLAQHGISRQQVLASPNGDFLSFSVSVSSAERLLDTEFFEFKHKNNGKKHLRCKEYTLPEEIAQIVEAVGPTVRLPNYRFGQVKPSKPHGIEQFRQSAIVAGAGSCSTGITPACLAYLYNIAGMSTNHTGNSAAVTGFLEQYISLSDLKSFFQSYAPNLAQNVPTITGPNQQSNPGTEASLDIQYLMGVAANVSATFWYTAGRQKHNGENEPFLVWLQNLASDANAPLVISTSYGDAEYSVNRQYAMRVNNEFVKAGLRGISLLYSSGDGGVDSSELGNCTVFVPTFPAGSPYVTAVGGSTSWNPETASNSFPSGGGFANFFSRPAYQQEAVTNYLTKYGQNLPASNLYNGTSGRGYPDIAFQSQSFWVIQGGIPQPVDGTSCASPSVSGLFTLLNDIRFAAGKPSLGFLNPFIYQYAAQFNDITQGSNPGCNSNGFQASQYWDPVTGWGSPDYKRLAAIVANLP